MNYIVFGHTNFVFGFFQDIFILILSLFGELDDIASPYFSRRMKLLETVAKLQFFVLMLDTGCEDLVLKLFKTFFNVVRFVLFFAFLYFLLLFLYCLLLHVFFSFCFPYILPAFIISVVSCYKFHLKRGTKVRKLEFKLYQSIIFLLKNDVRNTS